MDARRRYFPRRCSKKALVPAAQRRTGDRKSTRLNSSHSQISYAVFCLKKKKNVDSPIKAELEITTYSCELLQPDFTVREFERQNVVSKCQLLVRVLNPNDAFDTPKGGS